MLANAGWKVLFLGSGALGAGALEFPPHSNIRVKRLGFCSAGWRQKVHYALFALWVVLWTLLWRPQWVYASDPMSCPIAVLLSLVPRLRILYHEHDSPGRRDSTVSRFQEFLLKMR